MNEQKMRRAIHSVDLWNSAGLPPSAVPSFSCLDRNTKTSACDEIVLFPVIYELSIEVELPIDFTKPANKFVPFKVLSICTN